MVRLRLAARAHLRPLRRLRLVYNNAIEYYKSQPPGSVGAAVRAAAEASIPEILVIWTDRTIEIAAKSEAESLATIVKERTARICREQEAAAERAANALWEAEEARRRLVTVGSLVNELTAAWGPGSAAAGAAATVSMDAMLLSAQGCPVKPPRNVDAGLLPRLRVLLVEEELRNAQQEEEAQGGDGPSIAWARVLWDAALADGTHLAAGAREKEETISLPVGFPGEGAGGIESGLLPAQAQVAGVKRSRRD